MDYLAGLYHMYRTTSSSSHSKPAVPDFCRDSSIRFHFHKIWVTSIFDSAETAALL